MQASVLFYDGGQMFSWAARLGCCTRQKGANSRALAGYDNFLVRLDWKAMGEVVIVLGGLDWQCSGRERSFLPMKHSSIWQTGSGRGSLTAHFEGNYNTIYPWGCSSAGRAREWHSRGRGFDPHQLHLELPLSASCTSWSLLWLVRGDFPLATSQTPSSGTGYE